MRRLAVIALHTFREAVRDRVLHGVLGGGVFGLFVVLAMAELSIDQQQRVVADLGIALVSLLSVGVAVFLGSSMLARELERRTLYLVLPRPLARWHLLVGKYLGIALTGFVFEAAMGAVLMAVAALQRGDAPWRWGVALLLWLATAVGVGWRVRDQAAPPPPPAALLLTAGAALAARAGVDWSAYLAALSLCLGEVALLAAVAVFYSSFSTPFTTGLLTVGTWLVGRSVGTIASFPRKALGAWLHHLLDVVARVAPNFHLFAPGIRRLTERGPLGGPWAYVGTSWAYAAAYATVLLLAAALVFRRRDLP